MKRQFKKEFNFQRINLCSLLTSDYVQHFTLVETLQYAEAPRSKLYSNVCK